MFKIPNVSTPAFPGQAVPDSTDTQAEILADGGTFAVTGLTATPAGGREVTIAAGSYEIGHVTYELAAPVTVTFAAGSTVGDRRDIIVVTRTGTAEVVEGAPCTTPGWVATSPGLPPVKPAIPATTCLVWEEYVPANAVALTAENLTDKRVIEQPPLLAENDLGDVRTKADARAKLGLGSAATESSSAFDAAGAASAAQSAAETYAAGQATAAKTAAETYATGLVATERTRAEAAESSNATAISSETARAEAAEATKAPLASPTFTGTVEVPTPAATDSSTNAANTLWVRTLLESYLQVIPPSGDATGATDTAAIRAAWAALRLPGLIGGETYYADGQLVSPNLLGMVGVGGRPTLKLANGANLGVPFVTTANATAATPSTTPFPGIFATFIVTMNCAHQTYAGQAWLTGGSYYLNGPDAIVVTNKDWTLQNILVQNQPRNAFVTADASLGANTVGKYSGVGQVTAKAIGGNRLINCYAIGYGAANRIKVPGCSATPGGTTIKVPAGYTVKPGQTVIGRGVFPYTVVVSTTATGSSTIAHLSQKLARNPGTKFCFTYGWSRHWATQVENGSTDGWDLNGEAHHLNGAWQDRFEGAGGWQIENPYLWNGSYGQGRYLWGQHGKLIGGTFANAGWTSTLSIVIGTLATALGSGTTKTSLTLKHAVGANLAQFTPVLIPTPSGTPLVTCLAQPATAATTTLHVYAVTVPAGTTIAATTPVRLPFVYRQTMGLGTEGMQIAYGTEKAGNDVVYAQEISQKVTSQPFVSSLGAFRAENDGTVNGLSSVGISFVGFGTSSGSAAVTQTTSSHAGTAVTLKLGGSVTPAVGTTVTVSGMTGTWASVNGTWTVMAATATHEKVTVTVGVAPSGSCPAGATCAWSGHNWTIRRPDLLETGGILTKYTTAGKVTMVWPDGTPAAPAVAMGGGQITGTTTAAVIAKVPTTALAAGTGVTITNTGGKAKITAPAPTKIPASSLVAGTGTSITTTGGKAKITATGPAATSWAKTVTTVTTAASDTTFGAAKSLTPNPGMAGFAVSGIYVTYATIQKTETFTLKIRMTYNDGSHNTFTLVHGTSTSTTTGKRNSALVMPSNNLFLIQANGKYVAKLTISVKSSKGATATHGRVTKVEAYGTDIR